MTLLIDALGNSKAYRNISISVSMGIQTVQDPGFPLLFAVPSFDDAKQG
jgi:hypothetical protein